MHEESRKYGIATEEDTDPDSGERRLSKGEFRSLILILMSVVFWFFGYNAVTSKYAVYASSVLGLDYNLTLMIATGAAIVAYIPVGALASRIGRAENHTHRHSHTRRQLPRRGLYPRGQPSDAP